MNERAEGNVCLEGLGSGVLVEGIILPVLPLEAHLCRTWDSGWDIEVLGIGNERLIFVFQSKHYKTDLVS